MQLHTLGRRQFHGKSQGGTPADRAFGLTVKKVSQVSSFTCSPRYNECAVPACPRQRPSILARGRGTRLDAPGSAGRLAPDVCERHSDHQPMRARSRTTLRGCRGPRRPARDIRGGEDGALAGQATELDGQADRISGGDGERPVAAETVAGGGRNRARAAGASLALVKMVENRPGQVVRLVGRPIARPLGAIRDGVGGRVVL